MAALHDCTGPRVGTGFLCHQCLDSGAGHECFASVSNELVSENVVLKKKTFQLALLTTKNVYIVSEDTSLNSNC